MKKIMVLGGGGYLGTVLAPLLSVDYEVCVYDRFYFGTRHFDNLKNIKLKRGDTRTISTRDFHNYDVVIDLAGLSNDPSCDLDMELTDSINHLGATRAARCAKAAGVPFYIYSSSCSVYGASEGLSDEGSSLNPISAYARSKIAVEVELAKYADDTFKVICLRNATLYGDSPRMRFDLVVNMMSAFAFERKKIYIMGGGLQRRPLLHVGDCARIFEYFVKHGVSEDYQILNSGFTANNYTVREIAGGVYKCFSELGVELITLPDDNDKRSYNVDFGLLSKSTGLTPIWDLQSGVEAIKTKLIGSAYSMNDITTRTVDYYKELIKYKSLIDEISLEGRIF